MEYKKEISEMLEKINREDLLMKIYTYVKILFATQLKN